ncbi:MAG: DegT/DnrJ/EryC1/StrS family aminotransferase [Armatimonadota bacterium]|nr:DegT/DnrJ/EryC1/StrS family aminotransferase [Armatimonadota bacterium]
MNHVETRIPAENLTRQYQEIAAEVREAIDQILPAGRYTLGPAVAAFEQEWAAYCESTFAVGISNGTEALHLALLATGVGPGDEVITVCNTYVATAFAVTYLGATPVFVDVDPVTFNMNVDAVAAAVTPRTRAIIPVHMYGQPVDMDPLRSLAQRYGLAVIEDAAHSHGATYKGRKTGSLGDIGCFSFYPTKVLGCFGDGGAITTSRKEFNEEIRRLRYMGQRVKHVHETLGYQQRLDEIQAAILRVKLRHLDRWIAGRRRWAALYDDLLTGLPVVTPKTAPSNTHVFYLYTIRAERRDALMAHLKARGIGTQIIYPIPVPFQAAYASLGYRSGQFPVAEAAATEILCLPIFPELTEAEVRDIASAVREFYQGA